MSSAMYSISIDTYTQGEIFSDFAMSDSSRGGAGIFFSLLLFLVKVLLLLLLSSLLIESLTIYTM